MKKALVDTNIVIDLLARREPFYDEAARLFSFADRGEVSLYISTLTIANTYYLISKWLTPSKARSVLLKFRILVTILDLTNKVIDLSLNDNSFRDFEDGLQHYTALENGMNIILTRNLKDFKHSKLPAMTAKEYLVFSTQ